MTDWARRAWLRYWGCEGSAKLLGVQRALFFGVLFLTLRGFGQAPFAPVDGWSLLDPVFWEPAFPWRYLTPDGPPPRALVVIGARLLELSVAMSCLGLFTRVSTVTAAVSGFLMLPYAGCWGVHYHQTSISGLMLLVLAFSRCGDGFSLDALFWPKTELGASHHYGWPGRMACLALSMVFFAAGVEKLRKSGLEWIFSDNLSLTLTRGFYFPFTGTPRTDLGLTIAQSTSLCLILALLTIFFELFYPLGLLAHATRHKWLLIMPIGGALAICGFNILLGKSFYALVVAHVFWLPMGREEPAILPLGLARKILALSLTITVASSFAIAFRRSPFPFSCYVMYSTITPHSLTRYYPFAVKDDVEIPLWTENETMLAPTNRWVVGEALERYATNPEGLERVLSCLAGLAAENGHEFNEIRAYKCHWELRSGAPNILEPERELFGSFRSP